eukprot:CAMPEP_0119069560 /NCGR_PEP_ID=MMETSP1178-20130426/24309_1 /TAXON_ID=33656 /ORGANISM="unid sp, Strain CCMP2000" /LENGTH=139 /DNA_ID=CAMNT_0007051335 /DNA_START=11 /DNA_END=430 /DNA_ORIENTATION=-
MAEAVERATRLQRLDDSTSSLLEAYAKLIKSASVHGATEQQVSSFQSSVLVAGLLHTTDNLLALSGELKRAKLLNDDSGVQALAAQYRSRESESRSKLRRMYTEMQRALHELEESYYAPSCSRDAPLIGGTESSGGSAV